VVFACPHAGRIYPDAFLAETRLRAPLLRRSEDAYVDELFTVAADFAPFLVARLARVWLDVNRAPTELDPEMFDGTLSCAVERTGRVAAGFGVIARIVREGVEIYHRRLPPAEATHRIAAAHTPYHAALTTLLDAARTRFGYALAVDCHSMPGRRQVADIVLGDRFGSAAAPALTALVERAFAASGFSVARNAPFAGGYTTTTYGRPREGIHALQIEVNRRLYLDEERVEPSSAFAAVQKRIGAALVRVAEADIAAHCLPTRPLAAE
jgi:N-formylglutamate amidohydrolase